MSHTYIGDKIAINLWKESITNPTKFNHSLLAPPPAMTVVAVTNLKPSISSISAGQAQFTIYKIDTLS